MKKKQKTSKGRNANIIKTDAIYKYCLTYLFIILPFLFWEEPPDKLAEASF